jgi:hypothetical protein
MKTSAKKISSPEDTHDRNVRFALLLLCAAGGIACADGDESSSGSATASGSGSASSTSSAGDADETGAPGQTGGTTTAGADTTGGGPGGDPQECIDQTDPSSTGDAEYVCRGWGVAVYVDTTGTRSITPGGADEVVRCLDPLPADPMAQPPEPDHVDVRICEEWHHLSSPNSETPDPSYAPIIESLKEACRVQCENQLADQVPIPGVPGWTAEGWDCAISVLQTTTWEGGQYNPGCSFSQLEPLDHTTPVSEVNMDFECLACSQESQYPVACDWFDPLDPIGFTAVNRDESAANIDIAYLLELETNGIALWDCTSGRYAVYTVDPGDPPSVPPTSEWVFEGLAPGEFLYELGLRNGDKNASVWAFDPATGAAVTTVYALDTVDGMVAALGELLTYPNIAVEVERARTSYGTHVIEISQADCGFDKDGDGIDDYVRCSNP